MLYNTLMKKDYDISNGVVYYCKYHVVWCSKYKRKILIEAVSKRLEEVILSCASKSNITIEALEIMPDHIYLVVHIEPQYGIHKAVKMLKSETSKMLRTEFPYLRTKMPTFWTNSYFVSTEEDKPESKIVGYIENQKTSQRQKNKQG